MGKQKYAFCGMEYVKGYLLAKPVKNHSKQALQEDNVHDVRKKTDTHMCIFCNHNVTYPWYASQLMKCIIPFGTIYPNSAKVRKGLTTATPELH